MEICSLTCLLQGIKCTLIYVFWQISSFLCMEDFARGNKAAGFNADDWRQTVGYWNIACIMLMQIWHCTQQNGKQTQKNNVTVYVTLFQLFTSSEAKERTSWWSWKLKINRCLCHIHFSEDFYPVVTEAGLSFEADFSLLSLCTYKQTYGNTII